MSASEFTGPRTGQAGFTIIELMIGLLVGLFVTLGVTYVLMNMEGQKRTVTSGSDAQLTGALALATLTRTLQPAGYGFNQVPGVIGCALANKYGGAEFKGLPERLVPVVIEDGKDGAPDIVRVFASGKESYAMPLRLKETYSPSTPLTKEQFVPLALAGVQPKDSTYAGDLMVAAIDAIQPCEIFHASSVAAGAIGRKDDGGWNASGFPSQNYSSGNYLINLGQPLDATLAVSPDGALTLKTLTFSSTGVPSYTSALPVHRDIVNLQALYGKDTTSPPDGAIDAWNTDTPTTNAQWQQVVAVRVAVVARSTQFEREEVTLQAPEWDVGKEIKVNGAKACRANSGSECLSLDVSTFPEWKHYRYKVFDSIIPLRNMVWKAAL
ncbi:MULTISPECIES: PilW family protein [Variovorax]|jgi:type IV pilus assembly protein PilW|uniref:PilW family protein n=1 Tax=Variovorax TaxID=34072 RepID=UPI00285B2059|nr:PilW family protein [Variovorax sp. 3319]MDR6890696.1 type IV pilus assembly protein PilW [Variovorax sp. 3319]